MVETRAIAGRLAALAATFAATAATPAAQVPSAGAESPVAPRPWPHEEVDLPPDPRVHFGALENGLRYAWRANATPPGEICLRLHVAAGSLAEEEDERGMAHVLEHLLVEGVRRGPGGFFLGNLEERGRWFAGDQNAFTSTSDTRFHLDLPESGAEILQQGLHVLRSIAGGVEFQREHLEATLRVVDAEELRQVEQDGRLHALRRERQLAGARVALRDPLGPAEVRRTFTPEGLRAFHARWYRPELMTLIVVGDTGESDVGAMVREVFADLPVRSGPPVPGPGTPGLEDRFWCAPVPNVVSTWVLLERVRPFSGDVRTPADLAADTPRRMARTLLDKRLAGLVSAHPDVLLDANAESAEESLGALLGERIACTAAPGRWRDALALCERELRSAIEHGFSGPDVERERAAALQGIDAWLASDRASADVAQDLVDAARGDGLSCDPLLLRDAVRPALVRASADDCRRALAESWKNGVERAGIIGAVEPGLDCAAALRAALDGARALPAVARSVSLPPPFAYRSEALEPGAIVARERLDEADAHVVQFENGVRLAVKRSVTHPGTVLVRATIGGGFAAVAPERAAVAWVAPQVLLQGGLEAHPDEELPRIVAGRHVHFQLGPAMDRLDLDGRIERAALELGLEMLAAYVGHPGWRQSGMAVLHQNLPKLYYDFASSLNGPLRQVFRRELNGGDPRVGVPPEPMARAVRLADARASLDPMLRDAPLGVAIVGDVDVELAVGVAARTFGRLAKRSGVVPAAPPLARARAGLRPTYHTHVVSPSALVQCAWVLPEGGEPPRRAVVELLASVFQARLQSRVRGELQASYHAGVHYEDGRAMRPKLWADVQVAAGRAAEIRDVCLKVAAELAREGPKAEEIELARARQVPHARRCLEDPGEWRDALADFFDRPDAVERLLAYPGEMEAATREDVAALAKVFLVPERASAAVVEPRER